MFQIRVRESCCFRDGTAAFLVKGTPETTCFSSRPGFVSCKSEKWDVFGGVKKDGVLEIGNFGFGKIHKSGMCCIVRIGKMCYNIDIIWQCRPD